MANKRSALKAHRVSEKKHLRNRSVRSALHTFVRKAREGLAGNEVAVAETTVALASSQLDAAASKGVIHPNQAARRKSRLMHQLAVRVLKGDTVPEVEATPVRKRATRAPGGARTARAKK